MKRVQKLYNYISLEQEAKQLKIAKSIKIQNQLLNSRKLVEKKQEGTSSY